MNAVNPIPSPTPPAAGGAEPSMEEILASIRRIIADDGATPQLDGPRDHDADETETDTAHPVSIGRHLPHVPPEVEQALEPLLAEPVSHQLEEMMVADAHGRAESHAPEGPMAEPIAEPSKHPLAPSADVMGLGPVVHDEPVLVRPAPQDDSPPHETPPAQERLFASSVGSSVSAAFNTLAASRFVDNSEQLTGLVSEMIRPLVKTWVDENLPAMVERLVVAEIERMARGGR